MWGVGIRKVSGVALIMVLAGCEKHDVVHLTFNESVQYDEGTESTEDSSPRVKQGYEQAVAVVLEDQGISAGKVEVRGDPSDSNSLILSASSRVGESDEFKSFRQLLDDIVTARQALPVIMTLHPLLEEVDSDISGLERRISNVPEEIEVKLIPNEMTLTQSFSVGDMLGAATNGSETMSGGVFCNVSAFVDPRLSFGSLYPMESEDGVFGRYELIWNNVSVPAVLSFDSLALQNMNEGGELLVSPTADSRESVRSRMSNRLSKIDLQIGDVGSAQTDFSGGADPITVMRLQSRCEDRLIEIGQPFTFYLGESIDRLVEFSPIAIEE